MADRAAGNVENVFLVGGAEGALEEDESIKLVLRDDDWPSLDEAGGVNAEATKA